MTGPDRSALLAAFATPAAASRPRWRWWWNADFDAEECRAEIRAMRNAGFAGAEITWHPDRWADAAQRRALQDALTAAAEDDFEIDLTLAGGWPINSPATAAATGLAQLELQYGRLDLGTTTVDPEIPRPFDDPTNSRNATLIAVTAARVIDRGPAVRPPLRDSGPGYADDPGNTEAPDRSTVLAPDSLVNLTDRVSGTRVAWTPRAGDWILFAFWSRPTRQRDSATISLFDADSVTAALDHVDTHQLGPENLPLVHRVPGSFFEDSLEYQAQSLFWCRDLLQIFSDRHDYDLARCLPLLFVQGMARYWVPTSAPTADFVLADGNDDRIRADFRRLLDDLYAENHLTVMARWASGHGRRLRIQPAYGQSLNVTHAARAAVRAGGIAEDETLNAGGWGRDVDLPFNVTAPHWRFAFDHYRSVAGGSHQAGGTMITSELGASARAFCLSLRDYKTLMDNQWAAGISTPILHGYAFQRGTDPWPGTNWFPVPVSDSWNHRTFPEWTMLGPLADYWARGATILATGAARCDLAVLYDGFLTTAARDGGIDADPPRPLFDGLRLEQQGFRLEYIDSDALLEPGARGSGTLYPAGPNYRGLIIAQQQLRAQVAEQVADLAEQGLAVVLVGPLPDRADCNDDPQTDDRRLADAVQRILATPTGVRVDRADASAAALRTVGLRPDVDWESGEQVYTQHRETDDADLYYLYNPTSDPITFQPRFRAGGTPHRLDLWTGSTAPIPHWDSDSDTVSVRLTLDPAENVMLFFPRGEVVDVHPVSSDAELIVCGDQPGAFEVRSTRPGRCRTTFSTGRVVDETVESIDPPFQPDHWTLVVDDSPTGAEPLQIVLDRPTDWRDIPGLERRTGLAIYSAEVTIPDGWLDDHRGCYLSIGTVAGGSARIRLNDRLVHLAPVPPQRIEITDLARAGANQLRIEFASTLQNGARPDSPTAPCGLIGPVMIIPFYRALLAAATSR